VTVEVIDSVEDYGRLLARVFDFDALRTFLARPDFRMIYDALSGGACDGHGCADAGCSAPRKLTLPEHSCSLAHQSPRQIYAAWTAVAGVYAQKILSGTLGVPSTGLANCEPKPDFGGHHPDPNLTYASELVKAMGEALPSRQEGLGHISQRGRCQLQLPGRTCAVLAAAVAATRHGLSHVVPRACRPQSGRQQERDARRRGARLRRRAGRRR